MIYVASCNGDENLRESARRLYHDELGIDLPAEAYKCAGGRSGKVFGPCAGCPFMKCCKEKGITACEECAEYPCDMLSEYQQKYVNKFGQI
jgi:hypothetical protein